MNRRGLEIEALADKGATMRLRWMFGWALVCGLLSLMSWAQTPTSPNDATASGQPAGQSAAEDSDDSTAQEDGDAADGEAEDAAERPKGGVLSEFRRMLRVDQRHLTEAEEGNSRIWPTIAALGLAYVLIVLAVLAFWRRAKDPKFWRLRTEPMQGEGRWLTHIGYAIRRKVDADITLTMAKVEPEGCGVQLAYLVDGEIKGRLSEGSEGKVSFSTLKPKSFWQSNQRDSISIGFEVIQPRDRKISLYLDLRADYRIGKKSGVAGLFQELLVFEPSVSVKQLAMMAEDGSTAFETPSGQHQLGGGLGSGLSNVLDDTGGLGQIAPSVVSGTAPSVSAMQVENLRSQHSEMEQRLQLLETRFLSEEAPLDDVERRLRIVETQLESMPNLSSVPSEETERRLSHLESQAMTEAAQPPEDLAVLRQEIRSGEERAAKALRENLQVVVKNMKGLRHELTQLNTAVNDMMQRFVNSERRMADIAKRLPPEE